MSTYILRKGISTLADLANGNSAFLTLAAAGGQVFYVDAANGSDGNSGLTPGQARATILSAYNSCTSGNNDIVALIANGTSHTLSAALTWSKSYTHLVGLCAPTMIGQRARIFQLSTLTGASPLITVSGSGCSFSNVYIFQGVNDNTSLINVSVTGGRNHFENVHFAGSGHATMAIDGSCSLYLNGGAENTFKNCTFGVDTVAAATGVTNILVDAEAKRNVFEDCLFLLYAGATTVSFVEIVDSTGMDRFQLFKRCTFINDARGYAVASAFIVPASMTSVTNFLLTQDCMLVGITKLDASDRGVVYGNMNDVTGADTSGVAVEMIS